MSRMHGQGRGFYAGLLEALVQAMGTAKGYLYHHGSRVAVLAHRLGKSFDLSENELAELFFGSMLCDLGMIGMVEEAWENPVPTLPPEARDQVQDHPERSAETILQIPYLESTATLVRHHHEWWDGSGYPTGLAGDEIPFGAQILRVADTVAALGEDRPHRKAFSPREIRKEIEEGIGTEFGLEVGKRFLALWDRDEVHPYHSGFFRRIHHEAVEGLLPGDVSPLSSDQLLEIFGGLIDAKDLYTGGHSRRVADLSRAVAQKMGLGEAFRANLRAAGYLHDLGKLKVPVRVLIKTEALTDDERFEIQRHAPTGADILESIPSLQHLAPGARYHHERWDGRGYPEGLSGHRIPRVARILAVCDTYDAMTSTRAYRPARSHQGAMEEIERVRGSHLAPQVVDAFLSLPDETFQQVRSGEAPVQDHLFRHEHVEPDAKEKKSAYSG